jgi:hypothetical protein
VRGAGYDPDEMRAWMTSGAGAELTAQIETGQAPVELPAPSAPVSVMRNLRLPYEVDEALKAAAEIRGVTVSELIREAINALLAGEVDTTPDPVVALRLTLAAASRAVDRLAAGHPRRPERQHRLINCSENSSTTRCGNLVNAGRVRNVPCGRGSTGGT